MAIQIIKKTSTIELQVAFSSSARKTTMYARKETMIRKKLSLIRIAAMLRQQQHDARATSIL